MTDDVKIDYAELAQEAFLIINDLLKMASRLSQFDNKVAKFTKDYTKTFYDLKYTIRDNLEKMAALYFELKDKE